MTDYTLELKLKSPDGKIVWSDDVTMSIRSMIGFGEGAMEKEPTEIVRRQNESV